MSTTLPPAPGGNDAASKDPALPDSGGTSLWKDSFYRLRRNPQAIAGAIIVMAFLLVAALAPVLAPYGGEDLPGRTHITPTHIPGPGEVPGFVLGLDRFGGDLLSKLIWGAQSSLLIGVVSTALGLAGGMLLGVLGIAPQLAFLPGLCIAITALGFTLLGESLREALDPKSRQK
ncbi:hypothetical protein [Arthrobacter crystallopoietes]|uniref:N-terminal TM domain of oligopeptide transport permease C n=1 Tax=Crystallibacter crystallopoietes TaxID=37928 RepID=A0A1H1FRV0_9MICC|nr:hypothetical protein [Arthrobacter crystallopoietes]AUI52947.1 hypothetical protein AC20117_21305 [Arthrobacter crystallopoietes]SDR03610.1 N-terminal TM domain of oligopeptide transport permease C [Arthrobacter crystallopoietes]